MQALRTPVPLLAALLLAALLALGSSSALAADSSKLTVRTSLGPPTDNGKRPIRARGTAPKGARIYVRFYRGSKHLFTRKTTTRGSSTRYTALHHVTRTGDYRVRVTALTRSGTTLKVSARLTFAPEAEAPSAPEPEEDARRPA